MTDKEERAKQLLRSMYHDRMVSYFNQMNQALKRRDKHEYQQARNSYKFYKDLYEEFSD